MAEAIPGVLSVLLGDPSDGPNRNPQVQALLRTVALLPHYRSYPYAPGTVVFDETAAQQPLTTVWAASIEHAAGAACLQSAGCITSLFARAVAADQADADMVADDLFSWACRNIARSVLRASAADGRGGVEGVVRLAALLHLAVDVDGYSLADVARGPRGVEAGSLAVGEDLEREALVWVLGPVVAARWTRRGPVAVSGFTDALNELLGAVSPEDLGEALAEIDGIFCRLDALSVRDRAATPSLPPPRSSGPQVSVQTHAGFDDIAALASLRPRRLSSPPPGIASPVARMRRMTRAGQTTWLPPADAAVPLNASALAFLESHTALYPLRAWLRLVDARLVGQPALAALRASAEVRTVPPLPHVLPRLATIEGGMDHVILLLRRAFAFVVANANGYADSQWATSPLRMATRAEVDAVLGPIPTPGDAPARRYAATDVLDLVVTPDWPRMDRDGFLPKSRPIDGSGQTIREPPRLTPEEAAGADRQVCERACAVMLADLSSNAGAFILGGLHRSARRILGEHAVDLTTLDPLERQRVIVEELVPVLAGRVRGDAQNPCFFADCANVLRQLVALGGDTRRFRPEEPLALLAAEAAAIRRRAGAAEG
jgi:hypothetical protein